MIILKVTKNQPGLHPLSQNTVLEKPRNGQISRLPSFLRIKFGTKYVMCEYLLTAGLETIVIFQITTLKLAKLQRIVKKEKKVNLGLKIT